MSFVRRDAKNMTLENINPHEHAEALRQCEERLRLVTDAAELGLWIWQPDGDRISWDNERPYAIFGMARTDAPLTAARFAAEFVHPEDLTAFEQAIAHTVQTGARLFYQGRIHRPDGALRWIEFTGVPVPGPDGARLRVLGTVQDITERKQAEQLLRQNHDTFFNLIQNAPFGVYVVDAQFRLRHISTASQKVFSNIDPLLGRDFEEVLRLVWTDPFVSEALGHFRHTLQTGEPYAAPNTTEQRQNSPAIESYDWKIERINLPDGQFGVVCYFYDITESMQAGEALRQRTAQFETLINEAPLGVVLIDADFRVRQVNPIALPVYGNMPGLIGRNYAEVLHILWPRAQADAAIQQFRHTLETGEACYVPAVVSQRSSEESELIGLEIRV